MSRIFKEHKLSSIYFFSSLSSYSSKDRMTEVGDRAEQKDSLFAEYLNFRKYSPA